MNMGFYEYAEEAGMSPEDFMQYAKDNVKPLFAIIEPLKKLFFDVRYRIQYRERGEWTNFHHHAALNNDASVCRLHPDFKLPLRGEEYLNSLPFGTLVEYKQILIRINSEDGTKEGIFYGLSPLGEFVPVPDFDLVYAHNSKLLGKI